MSLTPREWKPRLDLHETAERLEALRTATGLADPTLNVCLMRGLSTPELIDAFLNPRFENLKPAQSLKDLDVGIERLVLARARGETIRIFGDYDVDGTSGAALLAWVLRDFGFQFSVRQPDRFRDGYGLNVRAIEEAKADGAALLLTVDCGITSFEAIEKAKELGIDVVILDHHQLDPGRGLPQALAVINPQREDCLSELKQLCGCGVAFYFLIALRAAGRRQGWFEEGKIPNLKQHLDLVVMATAADMVPLTGDNHILARQGLEVLKNSTKPGIQALLRAAGVDPLDIGPGDLGFVLAPRINASGRLKTATLAFDLLTTTDATQATSMAQELEQLNSERAEIQNRIWDEVRVRVEEGIAQGKFAHGIVVADREWHEGVVGIVASRVTETFRRPAAVISIREGLGKGSIRSYAGKDVLRALRECSDHLIGFGGHKHAAGLSVSPERVEAFAAAFDQALSQIEEDLSVKPLFYEAACDLDELSPAAFKQIENLGPFGPGNPEPVFVFKAIVKSYQLIKGRHLRLSLQSHPDSPAISAIWFHAAERPDVPVTGERREWAGVPELNRFRGRVTPTLRIKDSRKI